MPAYDLIGDIHGQADALLELLHRLGYRLVSGRHRHPDGRRAVFLGDFIDRGPRSRRVLEIVRAMIDAGEALAVMGNHEFNALLFHTTDPGTGQPLRAHTLRHVRQHDAFLREYRDDPAALAEAVAWFRTLPLLLDLGPEGPRVVHACWDAEAVAWLQRQPWHPAGEPLPEAFLAAAARPGTREHAVAERLLKGPEIPLPDGLRCRSRDGNVRRHARVNWWDAALPDGPERLLLPEQECRRAVAAAERFPDLSAVPPYPPDAPPVFFGHYWRRIGEPVMGPNWACLDWSAAAERGGHLACYRWEPDQPGRPLDRRRAVSVPVPPRSGL